MEDKRINITYIPSEDAVKVVTTESHNDGHSGDICQSVKTYGDVTEMQQRIEYLEKKIKSRDVMISEIQNDREYWRQRAEVLQKLHEEDQRTDKTEGLKGTIRGLEKTRDKLQAEVNNLRKKLDKSESRAENFNSRVLSLKSDVVYWCNECTKARTALRKGEK